MLFQPAIPPIPIDTNLDGKTVLITGGNTGIGLETARQMLVLKAVRVIITARNTSKGAEAVQILRQDPDVIRCNKNAKIEVFDLDLDDYTSGMEFCTKVRREVPRLDILVCNAGIYTMNFELSASGHERLMQVNCYTHFLIILELLPLLQSTADENSYPSRLTFVGSISQRQHDITANSIKPTETVISHFDNPKTYNRILRYGDSKLCVHAFVRQLAAQVVTRQVIVNNVCPGLVATKIDKNLPIWFKHPMWLLRAIAARPIPEGSRAIIHASCIMGAESHGKFISHNKIDLGAPFLEQDAGIVFTKRMWSDTLAELANVDSSLKISAAWGDAKETDKLN